MTSTRALAPVAAWRRQVWVILALYAALAGGYAWLNPVFEAPDEPFHVGYVNFLLRQRRWPQDVDIEKTQQFLETHADEAHDFQIFEAGQSDIVHTWLHPPLYYILQMPLLGAFYPRGFTGVLVPVRRDFRVAIQRGFFHHESNEQWIWTRQLCAIRLMRLLSVVLGGLAIWMTARIAALAMPESLNLPIFAAGLHASIPQFTFLSGTVNNDSLGYVASALGLWVLLRVLQRPPSAPRAALMVGLSLGLGLWSKATTLFLWPLTLAVGWFAYRRWMERGICALGAIAIGGVIAWPAYAGRLHWMADLLGFAATGRSRFMSFSTPFYGIPAGTDLGYLGRVLDMLGESFWGRFGWSHVPMDHRVLAVYWLVVTLALTGWCWPRPQRPLSAWTRKALTVLMGGVAIFGGCAGLLYARAFFPQGGRYLMTLGSAIAVGLALGLLRVRGRLEDIVEQPVPERGFVWGVLGLMVSLNGFVLWQSIYRAYAVAWGAAHVG